MLQCDISCNTTVDGKEHGSFAKLPIFSLSLLSLCVFYAYCASLSSEQL